MVEECLRHLHVVDMILASDNDIVALFLVVLAVRAHAHESESFFWVL